MNKYIKVFNTDADYQSFISGEIDKPNLSYVKATNEVHYNPFIDYSKEYLTFEALQNGTFTLTVPVVVNANYMTSISYSIDDGANWTTTAIDNTAQTITTPTIAQGDKVLWKGEGKQMSYDVYTNNTSSFSSTGNFNVSGNIMSLLYGDNFVGQTTFPNDSSANFYQLFSNCTKLISAENLALTATTLKQYCYLGMFYNCTSLTTAPELPATTLATSCYGGINNYNGMFENCTSLTTAPELPVTTLEPSCYRRMFYGCTALTTAPELPATTLVANCYTVMFYGCTNLNSIKMLATDISAYGCLTVWVEGVAATGTFTKDASMTTLPTGDSGIPSGWTVVDATA